MTATPAQPKPSAPTDLPLIALLAALSALGPISTDLYLPSLPSIGAHFARPPADLQLTLSVFLLGFAVSQLVYGPLADRYGRRPALLFGLLVYFVATLFCLVAPSLEVLIAARFLQAIGACAGPVVARAVVRDLYGAGGAARILSYLSTALALAPAVGPIVGGLVESALGWRSNFGALGLWAFAGIVAVWFRLPETIPARNPDAIRPARILANYLLLVRDARYFAYVMISSCAYGGLFAFISGSSFVLIEGLGLSPTLYGFAFAVMPLGYMAGAFSSGRLSGRRGIDSLILAGVCIASAAGLAGFVLALAFEPNVLAILVPICVYAVGCGLMMPNAVAGAIGPFPSMAATASALLGFLQMGLAAFVGIGVGHLVDETARGLFAAVAAVGLAALALAFRLRRAAQAR